MSAHKLVRKDFVWTSDIAYVVGLIATDGCLSKDLRHIELTSKDLEQVENFKGLLKLKNKIGTKTNGIRKGVYYRIQLGNIVFYEWLLKIGLTPHKSLTLGGIDIDKQYFRDFVRGSLDGDGNITHYEDRYNTYLNPDYIYERLIVRFFSGSKKHLLWLRDSISKCVNVQGAIITDLSGIKKGKNPNYSLKFSTKEAKVVLNWIYYKENLPCLRRKFDIAEPFLRI